MRSLCYRRCLESVGEQLDVGVSLCDSTLQSFYPQLEAPDAPRHQDKEASQVKLAWKPFRVPCDAENVRRRGLRRDRASTSAYYTTSLGMSALLWTSSWKGQDHWEQMLPTLLATRGHHWEESGCTKGSWRTELKYVVGMTI